jgi:hypothetical protein
MLNGVDVEQLERPQRGAGQAFGERPRREVAALEAAGAVA